MLSPGLDVAVSVWAIPACHMGALCLKVPPRGVIGVVGKTSSRESG